MANYYKLYDGLIVREPEVDPDAEWRYNDGVTTKEQFIGMLASQAEDLQKQIDGMNPIPNDDKYPVDVQHAIFLNNSNIGYNKAMTDLEEKLILLELLED